MPWQYKAWDSTSTDGDNQVGCTLNNTRGHLREDCLDLGDIKVSDSNQMLYYEWPNHSKPGKTRKHTELIIMKLINIKATIQLNLMQRPNWYSSAKRHNLKNSKYQIFKAEFRQYNFFYDLRSSPTKFIASRLHCVQHLHFILIYFYRWQKVWIYDSWSWDETPLTMLCNFCWDHETHAYHLVKLCGLQVLIDGILTAIF